jgi:hypothetical protein
MDEGRLVAFAASLVAMASGCGGSLSHATGGADASTDVGISGEAGAESRL